MRKLNLLIQFCLLSLKTFSQVNTSVKANVDPRIIEVFGDQLERLVLNDKDRLESLNKLLQQRVKIVVEPYATGESYKKLSEVKLFDKYNKDLKRDQEFNLETFNVLKYDLYFFSQSIRVYRIDNTDYIIKILSENLKE